MRSLLFVLSLIVHVCGMYTIQIAANENIDTLKSIEKEVLNNAIPTSIKCIETEKGKMYRLRAGLFNQKEDAQRVADFLGLKDIWIVKDTTIQSNGVKSTSNTKIQATMSLPLVYESKDSSFVFLLERTFGFEGAPVPGNGLLFNETVHTMKSLVSFLEKDSQFFWGKSSNLYFNPEGFPVDSFSNTIKEYARTNNVSLEMVESGIFYLNDGYDACIATIKSLNDSTVFELSEEERRKLITPSLLRSKESYGDASLLEFEKSVDTKSILSKNCIVLLKKESETVQILTLYLSQGK